MSGGGGGGHLLIIPIVVSRYLVWADYLYTVQVKSIQTSRPPQARVDGATPRSRFMTIAAFKIHPLELLACVGLDRHVSCSCELYSMVLLLLCLHTPTVAALCRQEINTEFILLSHVLFTKHGSFHRASPGTL